ncbi:GNAT family N-acetyltransferase [Kitasatospora sp. NPDC091207]|uniref:GNAT family N-acetyltransferase n=1 Tax=Kitasatospora sp. NPDC091207 TaxID=3364083 RepID=UPI0037FFD950
MAGGCRPGSSSARGRSRVSLEGGVHPSRRVRGIGRELLAWQLDGAVARHAEAAPEARWFAEVDAGVPDRAALRLYERLGFAVERYFLEMTAPTSAPPVPHARTARRGRTARPVPPGPGT